MIADLERDLEIVPRTVPDLEAARKVARDLAVIRNLEFMLGLAQAEFGNDSVWLMAHRNQRRRRNIAYATAQIPPPTRWGGTTTHLLLDRLA